MPSNPYTSEIQAAEKIFSKEIGTLLTKALQDRTVQKLADAKTNSSSMKPPKPVTDVFDAALAKAIKGLPKKYAALKVEPKTDYKMSGAQWIATVTAAATMNMKAVGGSTYAVKPGDTLWEIAKKTYGAGMYWPAIADANQAVVKSRGNFILAGVTLKIPKIDVPAAPVETPAFKQLLSRPPAEAEKPACPVAYPTLEFDLEKGSTIVSWAKGPGVTIKFTTTLKGSVKGQKAGTIPGNFNMRTYETELSNGAKPFQTSIKIKDFKIDSVTVESNVSRSVWKTSISMSKTGAIKTTISPKPVSFKVRDITYEGNVGLEMEIQIIPDRRTAPEPAAWYERAGEWISDNSNVIIGTALVAGAVILVAGTVGEDILTAGAGVADDPASFAAASAMFGRGLQMIH